MGAARRESAGTRWAPVAADNLTWRLALLGRTDVLLLAGRLSADYVALVLARGTLANRQALLELVGRKKGLTRRDAVPRLSQVPPATALYLLALLRQTGLPSSRNVYLAKPNIFSYHYCVQQDEQGELRQRDWHIVGAPIPLGFHTMVGPGYLATSKPQRAPTKFNAPKGSQVVVDSGPA